MPSAFSFIPTPHCLAAAAAARNAAMRPALSTAMALYLLTVHLWTWPAAGDGMDEVAAVVAAAAVRAKPAAFIGQHRQGCYGISPLGARWVYIQPQHTGTGTACRYIGRVADKDQCEHHHPPRPWPDADVAFTFAANPYRRVLSNAVFAHAIAATESPSPSTISSFREWVQRHEKALGTRVFPVSIEVDTYGVSLREGGTWTRATYVGRTTSIEEDLKQILKLLGYQLPAGSSMMRHCISNCAEVPPSLRTGNTAGNGNSTHVPKQRRFNKWFDEKSVGVVRRIFAEDFARYGFSTDPLHMYD